MRWAAILIALALVTGACGGSDAEPSETSAPVEVLQSAASEYALSAARALEGTVFEGLSTEDTASLVVAVCTVPSVASAPDAIISLAAEHLGPVVISEEDAAILTEVVAVGVIELCPETVAGLAGPVDTFLGVLRGALPEMTASDEALLAAGNAACSSLDAGSTAEEAFLVVTANLLGIEADSIAALEDSGLDRDGAATVGAVTASAAAILCPEHRAAVVEFAEQQ